MVIHTHQLIIFLLLSFNRPDFQKVARNKWVWCSVNWNNGVLVNLLPVLPGNCHLAEGLSGTANNARALTPSSALKRAAQALASHFSIRYPSL